MWDIWHLSSSTVFYKKDSCDVSYYSVEDYISFWYKRQESLLKSISDFGAMKSLPISRSKLIAKTYFNSINIWGFLTIGYLKYLIFVQNLCVLKQKVSTIEARVKMSFSEHYIFHSLELYSWQKHLSSFHLCSMDHKNCRYGGENAIVKYAILLFLCWHNKI